jgi:hypothetical protein
MMKKYFQRLMQAASILRNDPTSNMARINIPDITAEEVDEVKSFFPMRKFFIFGHARSGTTLLARLIRLHPEVHCNWQAHFFTRPPLLQSLVSNGEVGAWLSRRDNRWTRGKDLSGIVQRVVADYILEREAKSLGKVIVGDKSPNSLLNGRAVKLMHKVYPDGQLVFIVRDGRDAALSHRFQAFIDQPQYLSKDDQKIRGALIQNPEPFLRGDQSVFTEQGIRQAAKSWVTNVKETEANSQRLYEKTHFSLRYEDLLVQPWNELLKIWLFLGAKSPNDDLVDVVNDELNQNPDAQWQQEKANEIAGILQKGKQGFWKDMFTARDRDIYWSIAGETLTKWGYQR